MPLDIQDVAAAATRSIQQLDTVALNIAHSNTAAYKAIHLSYALQADPLSGDGEPGVQYVPYQRTDFSPGPIQRTGGALDAAIEGEGFFEIETGEGPAYIRKGSFRLDKDKQLVTPSGEKVLGESGPITIDGKRFEILEDGTLSVDGTKAGKLKVVAFDRPQDLQKRGDQRYVDPGSAGMKVLPNPRVLGQSLELSNVNALQEMVAMIDLQRTFEAYQKIIQTMGDQDRLSTTRVGKVV